MVSLEQALETIELFLEAKWAVHITPPGDPSDDERFTCCFSKDGESRTASGGTWPEAVDNAAVAPLAVIADAAMTTAGSDEELT